ASLAGHAHRPRAASFSNSSMRSAAVESISPASTQRWRSFSVLMPWFQNYPSVRTLRGEENCGRHAPRSESGSFSHSLLPPHQHLKLPGKVEQRFGWGQLDSCCLSHGVAFNFGFGILQGPRQVMDVSPGNSLTADRIQAVALGQEVFDRPFFSAAWLRDGTVA